MKQLCTITIDFSFEIYRIKYIYITKNVCKNTQKYWLIAPSWKFPQSPSTTEWNNITVVHPCSEILSGIKMKVL